MSGASEVSHKDTLSCKEAENTDGDRVSAHNSAGKVTKTTKDESQEEKTDEEPTLDKTGAMDNNRKETR